MKATKALWLLLGVLAVVGRLEAAEDGPGAELASQQEQVRARMAELERRVLEIADLVAEDRPEVARRLRIALAESRQRFIVARMALIRSLLSQEDYGAAAERQQRLLTDLAAFAALLDPVQKADELELLRRAAERIGQLAERQSSAAEKTRLAPESGRPLPELAGEQGDIRDDGAALLGELSGAPGSARLAAALRQMATAEAALAGEQREEALTGQTAAIAALQEALAEVREAIRSLTENSIEDIRKRLRVLLEEMAAAQASLRQDTLALEARRAASAGPTRAVRVAAGELAARQAALALHGEEARQEVDQGGGSPALSAGLTGLIEDIRACTELLREGTTDRSVTDRQEDIETVLRSLIAALAGASATATQAEPPKPEKREGEQKGRSLLGLHAELQVLADLQARLISRTSRLDEARSGEGSPAPPAVQAEAARLARGQSRITDSLSRIGVALGEAGRQ